MDINDGRFSMNGGCGYVLKPSVMRDPVSNKIVDVRRKSYHVHIILTVLKRCYCV